jgi:hypothetical protein
VEVAGAVVDDNELHGMILALRAGWDVTGVTWGQTGNRANMQKLRTGEGCASVHFGTAADGCWPIPDPADGGPVPAYGCGCSQDDKAELKRRGYAVVGGFAGSMNCHQPTSSQRSNL